jgi:hypothetical protein
VATVSAVDVRVIVATWGAAGNPATSTSSRKSLPV